MIKLIVFILLFVSVITAFSLNLDFLVQGFSNIQGFFNTASNYLTLLKELIQTLFLSPVLSTILYTGLAFIVIQYGLSLLGDERKE